MVRLFIIHVQVNTIETPSLARVVRHSPPPLPPPSLSVSNSQCDRRFSSNFIPLSSFKEPLSASKDGGTSVREKPSLSLSQHIEEGNDS